MWNPADEDGRPVPLPDTDPSYTPCTATEAIAALSFAPKSMCVGLPYRENAAIQKMVAIDNDRCAHAMCRNFAWRRSPDTKHAAPLLYRKSASQVAVFAVGQNEIQKRRATRTTALYSIRLNRTTSIRLRTTVFHKQTADCQKRD